jgi:hypothetical protein
MVKRLVAMSIMQTGDDWYVKWGNRVVAGPYATKDGATAFMSKMLREHTSWQEAN